MKIDEETNEQVEDQTDSEESQEESQEESADEEETNEKLKEQAKLFDDALDEGDDEEMVDVDDGRKNDEGEDKEKNKDDDGDEDSSAEESKKPEADSEIPSDMLQKAKKLGMSDQQIESIGSESALATTLSVLEENAQGQEKGEGDKTEKETKNEEQPPEYDCGLEKFNYEPEIVRAFNDMGNKFLTQIRDQKTQIDNLQTKIQEVETKPAVENLNNDLDAIFVEAAESDAIKSILGGEKTGKLKSGSDEAANRRKVVQEMHTIASGYEGSGKQPPDLESLFAMSMRNLFPEQTRASLTSKNVTAGNARRNSAMGRGSRGKPGRTQEDKVYDANAKIDQALDE